MHYVIGDIHGQLPAVKALVEDKIKFNPKTDYLYFLGDYTDWGCDSIGALQYVKKLENENEHVYALLGNHDLMMRNTIHSPEDIENTLHGLTVWKRNNGDVTLRDFLKLPEMEQKEIMDWLDHRPVEVKVRIYDRTYWLCHGAPLTAVRYLGWREYAQSGIPEPGEDEYIHDAVWYRFDLDSRMCEDIPELKDGIIVRGHSITESRRVECWNEQIINIDCGAKVFCPLLDDPDWDQGGWKGEFQPRLSAFCLEDDSVLEVTMDDFRKMAEKDLVSHYTKEDRERRAERRHGQE